MDIINTYSMSDLKLVYNAYHNDDLTFSDQELLDEKLAEMNAEVNDPSSEIIEIPPL